MNRYMNSGAVFLSYVVAGLHLFHPQLGLRRLVVLLSMSPELLVADPRPIAFVLSGIVLFVGVTAAILGAPRKPLYVFGMALMATYIIGYLAWHLTGHGGFLPGREPLHHGLEPHETVINHLSSDLWAAITVSTEWLLFAMLMILYYGEQ